MNADDLRRRVGAILAAEEQHPPDWAAVNQLTDELLQQLMDEPDTVCPEIVNHYLDDADIRSSDEAYGRGQRKQVRQFVSTGEYKDSERIPMWTCALALAVVVCLVGWLLW